jgi:hypothetical protein
MIKDFKKSFYHSYVAQCMRLFVMVKLFQLKASNRWSDCSFKDLLTLIKDMLPVIPHSEIAGMKPPYVCPGCFIHTYSNNMMNRFHVQ